MREERASCDQRGIALILALLALLLLTAVALTLATSSTIETLCAGNYRWSRKAFYNAEAGVAVGQAVLRESSWRLALPPAREPWQPAGEDTAARAADAPPVVSEPSSPSRAHEMAGCDQRGNGMGYGHVLFDGAMMYENVSAIYGQRLDGAFTLWVRRPLLYGPDGEAYDDPRDDVLILVSEGVAPALDPRLPAPQAVQVVEVTLYASHAGVTIGPAADAAWQPAAATTTPYKLGSSVCR